MSVKTIIGVSICVPIVLIFWITYSRIGAFMFAGGSDSILRVVRLPLWIAALTTLLLVISIIYIIHFSLWGIGQRIYVFILFFTWILSGHAIGIYPDGRIMSGWYFFPVNVTSVVELHEDPEASIVATSVSVKNYSTLEFVRENNVTTIYISPWLKDPLLKILADYGFRTAKSIKDDFR